MKAVESKSDISIPYFKIGCVVTLLVVGILAYIPQLHSFTPLKYINETYAWQMMSVSFTALAIYFLKRNDIFDPDKRSEGLFIPTAHTKKEIFLTTCAILTIAAGILFQKNVLQWDLMKSSYSLMMITVPTIACGLYFAMRNSLYTMHISGEQLDKLKKTTYSPFTSEHARRAHAVAENFFFLPTRKCFQSLAYVIQPAPGAGKEDITFHRRILGFIGFASMLPFAVAGGLIGLFIRACAHRYRPIISYIDNSATMQGKVKTLKLAIDNPIHVRTHNVGFVTTSMGIVGDLRDPEERAREVVESVKGNPRQPDVIFFLETFHEDATKVLTEGLMSEYPFIIHNVGRHISGFSNGTLVVSKYPIKSVDVECFDHMLGPEKLAPRGIVRVELETEDTEKVFIYGAHTQALLGEERSQSRNKQIEQLDGYVNNDGSDTYQIIVGDFNTSSMSAWGEDNLNPANQSEVLPYTQLTTKFHDLFTRDHDEATGVRNDGQPLFKVEDNDRMGVALPEPSGSWYHGPFANRGRIMEAHLSVDRMKHGTAKPAQAKELEKSTWGTKEWSDTQVANTARFDYILLRKNSNLTGLAEIRRVVVPKGAQSASTDHLPVDALIWKK